MHLWSAVLQMIVPGTAKIFSAGQKDEDEKEKSSIAMEAAQGLRKPDRGW